MCRLNPKHWNLRDVKRQVWKWGVSYIDFIIVLVWPVLFELDFNYEFGRAAEVITIGNCVMESWLCEKNPSCKYIYGTLGKVMIG